MLLNTEGGESQFPGNDVPHEEHSKKDAQPKKSSASNLRLRETLRRTIRMRPRKQREREKQRQPRSSRVRGGGRRCLLDVMRWETPSQAQQGKRRDLKLLSLRLGKEREELEGRYIT